MMEGGGEGRLKKSYAYIQDVTPERGGGGGGIQQMPRQETFTEARTNYVIC